MKHLIKKDIGSQMKNKCIDCKHAIRLNFYYLDKRIPQRRYFYSICNRNKDFENKINSGKHLLGYLVFHYEIPGLTLHCCKHFSKRSKNPWPDTYYVSGKCDKLIFEKSGNS